VLDWAVLKPAYAVASESCGVDNGILEFRCGDPQPIILSPNIDLTIASSLLKYTPRGCRNSTILLDARASQNGPA
jgi:hypothetical protein